MFKVGLCSVTFRDLPVEQVITLAKQAKLDGIEWGGDIHVPPGDMEHAAKVAEMTEQANLDVSSYGSYYRLGHENNEQSFEVILETAKKLKAPSIRVWAGKLGSDEADENDRLTVVKDAKRIGDIAKSHHVFINLEFHGNTLTDTPESASTLMREINHPNINLYWQPAVNETIENRLKGIKKVYSWLTSIHVFHWKGTEKLALEEGFKEWEEYLNLLKEDNGVRYLLMEFVKDDNPEQFLEDAKILKNLVGK